MRNRVTEMFGVEVPIFGFTHKPEVAIEVTNAGGMGALAASYYQPDELERILTDMDRKTAGRPYCIDVLFANKVGEVVPLSDRLKALPKEHIAFVDRLLDDAGIPPLPPEVEAEMLREKPPGHGHTEEGVLEVLEVVVRHPQAKFVLSAMGAPPAYVVDRLHGYGIKVGAMAGSAEHARKQVQAGVDLVVAQGSEAGGHTGTISSMVLWPEVVDAIAPVPVLAAGGVGSGRHLAAAFALGAEGVWCGTIWLGSPQSELSPEMRKRVLAARSQDAIQRKYDTGKPLRGLRSKWSDAWDAPGAPQPLPLAAQKLLVAPALKRLELANAVDYMGYMTGQIVGRIKEEQSIRQIMDGMTSECRAVLKALGEKDTANI
ncbi:nitronate monooxygenase [Bradyrhizobium genosp. L]|uniref:NAD(P)H-dependent flavin oxidoreductase n=1 Tax=Bradyrhizobium genosp. L TaxID=83637 RepID=UPI0018A278DD|nr:nitronate monooxygenase family protein [Bradyrhizobium genosp. L]QPF81785.1 nitronate monooxygenase [Bradyrhizobium genosp. L]